MKLIERIERGFRAFTVVTYFGVLHTVLLFLDGFKAVKKGFKVIFNPYIKAYRTSKRRLYADNYFESLEEKMKEYEGDKR